MPSPILSCIYVNRLILLILGIWLYAYGFVLLALGYVALQVTTTIREKYANNVSLKFSTLNVHKWMQVYQGNLNTDDIAPE